MFHLLGFGAAALDSSTGNVQLNGVADQLYNVNAGRFRLQNNQKILFAYAGAVGMTRARLVAPHFRVPALPQIMPINAASVVPSPMNLMDFIDNPLQMYMNEELSMETTTAAAVDQLGFVGIADNDVDLTIPKIDLRWARFTTTPTSGTLSWGARAEITFEDVLDSGVYGVYGLRLSGTALVAGRLIFNNQYMRPGCIGQVLPSSLPHPIFDRALGLWGTFENSTPPGIEAFATAGGANALQGMMLIQLLHRM